MFDGSVFNIDSASLTLGAVLAKGSSGITLYRAELQLGTRPIEVTCMGMLLLDWSVSPDCRLSL